jgi:2-methylisocitrate lyase-like PEP mutase family enzyme
METDVKLFKALHRQAEPLLLGNVWSVQSAKVFEKLNFKAIGTSSAAVAEMLGYKDGEYMPFEEYFFIVKRIKASTSIPLSVDLEAGYGKTPEEIAANIKSLCKLGVVGINIEDSVVKNSVREIVSEADFTKKLLAITNLLSKENVNFFVNVRCDAFLLNLPNARAEAIRRIAAYEKTGVHGIFLPCITDVEDIRATVNSTKLPVNVLCMPGLPVFDVLKSLDVKRISMGNFINGWVYKKLEESIQNVIRDKSFSSLFH